MFVVETPYINNTIMAQSAKSAHKYTLSTALTALMTSDLLTFAADSVTGDKTTFNIQRLTSQAMDHSTTH